MSFPHRFWVALATTVVLLVATAVHGIDARCLMESPGACCPELEHPVIAAVGGCGSCMAPGSPEMQASEMARKHVEAAPAFEPLTTASMTDTVVGALSIASAFLTPSPPSGPSLSIRLRVLRI